MTDHELDDRLANLARATEAIAPSASLRTRMLEEISLAGLAEVGGRGADSTRPSASAQARARREARTWLARVRLWWTLAPAGLRFSAVAGCVAAAILLLFGARAGIAGRDGDSFALFVDHSPEKFPLTAEPSKDCYGLGDGATVQTFDKLQMTFNFPVTAKKASAVLRFSAASVARSEEIDVSVNAVHMGFVEPTFGVGLRTQEIQLNARQLRPNDTNTVVFDNLRNPPNHEPWVICRASIEVTQLPDAPPSELRNDAKHYIDLADRLWDSRSLAAPNAYQAWVDYKKARQFLEALEEKDDNLDVVKQRIKEAEHELNEKCSHVLLEGAAAEKTGKAGDALKIYDYGLQWFPGREYPCFEQLREKIAELE